MENLDEVLKKTVDSIKGAVGSEEVMGKPIIGADGSVVLPVNKVSYGFVVGGGEYGSMNEKMTYPYSAASGGGVTVTPIGFLICGKDKRFISVDKADGSSKIMDLLKGVVETMKEED